MLLASGPVLVQSRGVVRTSSLSPLLLRARFARSLAVGRIRAQPVKLIEIFKLALILNCFTLNV